MYVALVPNRSSPPAYLLREGYREDGKVKSRTLANLSHWPLAKIERLRRVLRDEVLGGATEGLTMLRSLPHGHVAAVLGIARKIGLDRLLAAGQAPARLATLVLAMILARVIDPASKLATARQLDAATATSSLGPLLELGTVSEQELYAALDWLLSQQSRIESRLAQRHLSQGTLVLYDVLEQLTRERQPLHPDHHCRYVRRSSTTPRPRMPGTTAAADLQSPQSSDGRQLGRPCPVPRGLFPLLPQQRMTSG